jgi:hypothetical protein
MRFYNLAVGAHLYICTYIQFSTIPCPLSLDSQYALF